MSEYLESVYIDAQKSCGLKVGDYVVVTGKAESRECGWDGVWLDFMDEFIGKIGRVVTINLSSIKVDFCEGNKGHVLGFPYFVLRKINMFPVLKPFDKVLVRDEDKNKWLIDFFMLYKGENASYPFMCFRTSYKQCLPYDKYSHLFNTTNAPDDITGSQEGK